MLVPPSPKSQAQPAMGALPGTDVSVKTTASGTAPLVVEAVNEAVGAVGDAVVVIVFVAVLLPADVVTVSAAVKDPAAL